jgi:carbonic anhydrase/acetyltransferase-like protein (isoleucine patch superfamily)
MLRAFGGKFPRLGDGVYVDPSAQVIGDVEIGANSSVWCGAVLRGDVHFIRIGARTNIQDLSVLHVRTGACPVILGGDVVVGHRVVLHGCTVADHALIGIGAVVLDEARIGEYAMIAAGSVVPPGLEVPPRSLALGAPAKVLRELRPAEIEMIDSIAANYLRLKDEYLQSRGSLDGSGLEK